ncbi:MAG: hypothetical protein AAGF48_10300 [Pseudomonadota bacterium]
MSPGGILVAALLALVGAFIGWRMGRRNYKATLIMWLLLAVAAAGLLAGASIWGWSGAGVLSILAGFGIIVFLIGSVPSGLVAMFLNRKA